MPEGPDGSRGALKPVVAELLDYLQLAIRLAPTTDKDPHVVLRLTQNLSSVETVSEEGEVAASVKYVLVVGHAFLTESSSSGTSSERFEATLFRMAVVGEVGVGGECD